MATQALQLIAVDRLAALLEALKTERVLKEVYYSENTLAQANETPFVYFRLAADEEYVRDEVHGGGPRYIVSSRLLLSVWIRRKVNFTTRELAEMIDILRRRIISDLPDPECTLRITTLTTFDDPWVANLGYKDFGAATIAIDYSGADQYD